jgi:hypothetical protein
MTCARFLAQILVLYVIVSGLEWVLHAKVMHGDPRVLARAPLVGVYLARTADDHVAHHRGVGADMRLVRSHDANLAFHWGTVLVLSLALGAILLATRLYSACTVLWLAPLAVLLFTYTWNCWHSRFHDVDAPVRPGSGTPNRPELPTRGPYYCWLWTYHALHHTQKGRKGNFNIICPGFDWLMGTRLSECYDNVDYCSRTPDTAACHGKLRHCYGPDDVLPRVEGTGSEADNMAAAEGLATGI